MKLKKIEELFNEIFDFENLKKMTYLLIQEILLESDTNFLSEEPDEGVSYKDLKIVYHRTHMLINDYGRNPYVRLQYYLYEDEKKSPSYIYEIEYGSDETFLDEYFLKFPN